MKHNIANQNGFSLLEILIAMFLLAVGIFSILSMQVTAIKSNSAASTLSSANALAQETMDDIMAWDISDPKVNVTTADVVYDLNGPNEAGTNKSIPGAGTFSSIYSTTTDTPVAGTTQIVVKIYKVINGVNDTSPLITLTACKRVT